MLIGEGENTRHAYRRSGSNLQRQEVFADFLNIYCVLPFGGVRIAGPIVMAQHKGNERINKVRPPILRVLSVVIEITY
jgi:hypothetical protein